MKLAFVVFALGFVCISAKGAIPSKPQTRLIPADVLRDFNGMCFASTRCATIKPGDTWSLSPFCGRSTCVLTKEGEIPRLLEMVEDCGPLPIHNAKCKIDEASFNKTADYPDCCPVFTCEDGETLEFPKLEPPTGAATSQPKA